MLDREAFETDADYFDYLVLTSYDTESTPSYYVDDDFADVVPDIDEWFASYGE